MSGIRRIVLSRVANDGLNTGEEAQHALDMENQRKINSAGSPKL